MYLKPISNRLVKVMRLALHTKEETSSLLILSISQRPFNGGLTSTKKLQAFLRNTGFRIKCHLCGIAIL